MRYLWLLTCVNCVALGHRVEMQLLSVVNEARDARRSRDRQVKLVIHLGVSRHVSFLSGCLSLRVRLLGKVVQGIRGGRIRVLARATRTFAFNSRPLITTRCP